MRTFGLAASWRDVPPPAASSSASPPVGNVLIRTGWSAVKVLSEDVLCIPLKLLRLLVKS